MTPINDAATYTLATPIIYAASGWTWTIILGIILIISALARSFVEED